MSKTHRKQFFILLFILFAVCSITGTVAADNETTEISPLVFLTFDKIPQDIISGTEITINVSSEIDQSLLTDLKNINGVSINNIAYLVTITSKEMNFENLTGAFIQLPVSHTWAVNHSNIHAVTIINQTMSLLNTSFIGVNEDDQDVFQVNLSSVPDDILLVSIANTSVSETPVSTPTDIAETKTQTATQTPASPSPLLWTAGFLVLGILLASRRRD